VSYAVVSAVALLVSALTLFSSFGLGTLLMPAFALFFPVPIAVAATAVVHLANNLFKLVLVGRRADPGVVVRFALPAAAGAMLGHQGALRSAFLVNAGLDKEAFIGTSVVSAVLVDLARLLVYGVGFYASHLVRLEGDVVGLVGAATLAAFAGSFAGTRLLGAVTMRSIRLTVGAMLLVVALGLGAGLL
jgi:uncharacterized membrane protein YfcA